jgi:hypothetical protein
MQADMTSLRAILFGCLALLLTVTAVAAASARGAMAADGVICNTGSLSVVIAADGLPLFDDGGAPVELTSLPCLDCVFGTMALASEPQMPASVAIRSLLGTTRPGREAHRVWRMGGKGRSPPLAA